MNTINISPLLEKRSKEKTDFFKNNNTTSIIIKNEDKKYEDLLENLIKKFFKKYPGIIISNKAKLYTSTNFKDIHAYEPQTFDLDFNHISSHQRLKILHRYQKILKTLDQTDPDESSTKNTPKD